MTALALGCFERERGEPPAPAPTPAALERAEATTRHLRARGPMWSGAVEGESARDPLADVLPSQQVPQRLAFSGQRFAFLRDAEVSVYRTWDFRELAQFNVADGRNLVSVAGSGFLALGSDALYRYTEADAFPEALPRAVRIGPTTLLPSSVYPEQFWLAYEGIAKLARFDFGVEPITSPLDVITWTELPGFDFNALLGFGDGSFVYTVPDGLARVGPDGQRERLPSPELAGRVWRLLRTSRRDEVWAVTERHVYLLELRDLPWPLERFELPPHVVAVASAERELAILSLERLEPAAAGLRVDIHHRDKGHLTALRVHDLAPPSGDAGAEPAFRPEVALASGGVPLVALSGYGVHVYDWSTGSERFSLARVAQNLATPAE